MAQVSAQQLFQKIQLQAVMIVQLELERDALAAENAKLVQALEAKGGEPTPDIPSEAAPK